MPYESKREFVNHEKERLWDTREVLDHLEVSAKGDMYHKWKRKFKDTKRKEKGEK